METVYIPTDQSQTELLKEQLRLAYGDEADEAGETAPVVEKECSGPDPARQALERKYSGSAPGAAGLRQPMHLCPQ